MRSLSPLFVLCPVLLWFSCTSERKDVEKTTESSNTTFRQDVEFLKKYTDLFILEEASGNGKVAVSGSLQGRVMTSSSNGFDGRSYGWINRDLFESGDTLDHINPFGGEERFWLGPEGGQYSIFFENGAQFNLENWQTPRLIDLEPFDLDDNNPYVAKYRKSGFLTNYSGFTFELGIEREIQILLISEIFQSFWSLP